jgi:serine/threonine protein kinase
MIRVGARAATNNLAGATPFEGESPCVVMNARVTGAPEAPRKINLELNPAIEEVILHAMERDPRKRYQSGVEMTHRDQRLRAPQPWKSRNHTMLLIVGFVLLDVALLFVMFPTGPSAPLSGAAQTS